MEVWERKPGSTQIPLRLQKKKKQEVLVRS